MAPTIVFDLDGTLVDTARDIVDTLNAILATEGMAPVPFDDAVSMVGRGSRTLLTRAFTTAGRALPPAELERLFALFLDHYDNHLADHSRPYPGAGEVLDQFQAAGWRLAVCTNKYEAPARRLLEILGLAPRFAAISGQDTFGFSKPDPRHLTETIRAAGGDPADAIMVGDSSADVDTALAANIPVVAVTFGYTPVPARDLGATRVIDHFAELYDAVAAIRSGR